MTDHEDAVNVFSKKFTGGPLGLGDPNDRTLRHVEESVNLKFTKKKFNSILIKI